MTASRVRTRSRTSLLLGNNQNNEELDGKENKALKMTENITHDESCSLDSKPENLLCDMFNDQFSAHDVTAVQSNRYFCYKNVICNS